MPLILLHFSSDMNRQQGLLVVSVIEASEAGYGKCITISQEVEFRVAVFFLHFLLVLHTDMECKMAVPSLRAYSGHISVYQRELELHARVTVDFWEDDCGMPHSHCQEDHVLVLLQEPKPLQPWTLQLGRASATLSLLPSSTNVHKIN